MAQKSARRNRSPPGTDENNLLCSAGIVPCESSREQPSCGLLACERLGTNSGGRS